jgi:hypothetical protein
VQQGENKGQLKELTEQANSPDLLFPEFFPDFSKRHQLESNFFIFSLFFYIFL